MIISALKSAVLVLLLLSVESYSGESSLSLIVSDKGYFYQGSRLESLDDISPILLSGPEVNLLVCFCADTYLVNDAVSYVSDSNVEKLSMSHISDGEDLVEFCSQC